jgi:hypothetical protein
LTAADYIKLATEVLKKVKGYCQNQATSEMQVLALAEQLDQHHLTNQDVLFDAVRRIGGSAAAADPDYRMTPARIVAEAKAVRSDDWESPEIDNGPPASEEQREKHMARINEILAAQSRSWSIPR